MNLATWIQRNCALWPDRPALAKGCEVHATWETFGRRVRSIAHELTARFGCVPGDRIAIVMSNCPEYLEMMFGGWHAGCVVVPVNARLHRDEVAYILSHSGARVMVTDTEHEAELTSLESEVSSLEYVLSTHGAQWSGIISANEAELVERSGDDAAWLFYTSGTTGRPKGATLTHRNLLMMSLSYFADIGPVSENDAVLHAAPISHGSGLYGLPHVARGAVSVIPASGSADPAEIAELLGHWSGVSMFAAPTMIRRLCVHESVMGSDLAGLKTIIYGGAPMYLEDLKLALAIFGPRLAQIYGQGETPMTITALSMEEHADTAHPQWVDRMKSVGRARTDVEVKVVDESGLELAAGEIGEILVRGDVVMAGYWNQPDATAETLAGGWLHTGDLGSFDSAGYLSLHDRSKDLIISGGMNIYPREIEEVLLRHDNIEQASVVGRPDPEWGESVVAFFVVRDGADTPSPEELDELCLSSIARYKRPKEYIAVEHLPTNNYGKVLKRELRERLVNGEL